MNPMISNPGKPVQRGILSRTPNALAHKPSALITSMSLLVLLTTMSASAIENRSVEHPGSVHTDDNCSSCHADKARGKSVHSAMALSCTVCHLAQTQGDMTTLTLLMAKPKICFACHEQTLSVRQHRPAAKGLCLDCHDAHSSNRRMLLREPTYAPRN